MLEKKVSQPRIKEVSPVVFTELDTLVAHASKLVTAGEKVEHRQKIVDATIVVWSELERDSLFKKTHPDLAQRTKADEVYDQESPSDTDINGLTAKEFHAKGEEMKKNINNAAILNTAARELVPELPQRRLAFRPRLVR